MQSVKAYFLIIVVSLGAVLFAQSVEKPASSPPSLSEVQRLQIQTLSQKLELAQLRAQLAQRDFDDARNEITRLVATLQVKGYTLDPNTWTYSPESPKPEVKP